MKTGKVQVDGAEYEWSIHRPARWTGDGVLLGPAFLVQSVKSGGRDLVLEFSLAPTRLGEIPPASKLRVSNRRLTECIQNALQAGWDPSSRGKSFFFDAGQINPG